MRGTLIFWANGFWNDSTSKYQIFCFNVTDVRTLYARARIFGRKWVFLCPTSFASVQIYFSVSWGDLKWFGSRSQIIWREWENLSQLRMRGGLVWRKLLDSTANRCQLLLNISYQLVLSSHLHSNRWHYPSCCSVFWVLNFSHLSHFGLLERVSQLSGSDSCRPSCTCSTVQCTVYIGDTFFPYLFLSIFSPLSFSSFLFFSACPNSLWPSYLWLESVSGASHEIVRKRVVRWSPLFLRYNLL